MTRRTPILVIATLLIGCKTPPSSQSGIEKPSNEDSLSQTSQLGPVKATVTASPKQPTIGDRLTLTLEVEAKAGVEIEMPPFGEALGRFVVVNYRPRHTNNADGSSLWSQTYTLQASASGRQRIPSLRIEFTDNRPDRPADAGTSAREILTEPLSIQVTSVLPSEDLATQLKPKREILSARKRSSSVQIGLIVGTILCVIASVLFWLWVRRTKRERSPESAYDIAVRQLSQLETRGLPEAEEIDVWYVELSSIIRNYLEDRYHVRAPELTTEEFLREAKQSEELTEEHRTLLSSFLEGCDRVKFAGYFPQQDESSAAFVAAKQFVLETRPVAEENTP